MEVKTKADIGDTVFYIYNNAVCSSDVLYINIHIYNQTVGHMAVDVVATDIKYKVCHYDGILEKNIYLSKEEIAQAVIEGTL